MFSKNSRCAKDLPWFIRGALKTSCCMDIMVDFNDSSRKSYQKCSRVAFKAFMQGPQLKNKDLLLQINWLFEVYVLKCSVTVGLQGLIMSGQPFIFPCNQLPVLACHCPDQ